MTRQFHSNGHHKGSLLNVTKLVQRTEKGDVARGRYRLLMPIGPLEKDAAMLNLPRIIIDLLNPFAPCFYGVTTWAKAPVLLGAILTPGKRVVTEALPDDANDWKADFAAGCHTLPIVMALEAEKIGPASRALRDGLQQRLRVSRRRIQRYNTTRLVTGFLKKLQGA